MMRSRAFVRGCSFLLKRRHQYYRDRVILTTGRQLRRLSVVQDNNNKNKEDEIPTIKTSENDATASSCASIYNPPPFGIQDERLARNVRSCLREHIENPPEENDEVPLKAAPVKDTGMSICFLGTSAGSPTRFRSPTSTLVRLGGKSLLFDVGEGTQRQMDFTRAKPSHVDSIFITHLHGDHIFGLPGFLLFLQYSKIDEQRLREQTANAAPSKNRKQPPEHTINIYGPPGLYNYVAASTTMACTSFQHVQIIVHELVGGRVKRVRTSGQHKTHKDPFYHTYQEFEHSYLTRKIIPCDQNGIWNIEDFTKNLTREEILSSTKRNTEASSTLRIRAAEVDHLPGVKTFGYVLQEKDPPRNIDASKAEELGVPGGKKYELLKHGYSVHSEDGERLIHPEEVWTDRRRAARKIAIVGDNRAWRPELEHIARDADVLVHEATLHKFNYLVSNSRCPQVPRRHRFPPLMDFCF